MTKFTTKKGFTLTPNDLINFNNTVIKFNTMMGNDLFTTDPEQKAKLLETYRNLSLEELTGKGELIESIEAEDKAGILDGLCDLIYTGFAYCTLEGGRCNINRNEDWVTKGSWKRDNTSTTGALLEGMVHSLETSRPYGFQTEFLNVLGRVFTEFDIVAGFDRVTESNFSKVILTNTITDLEGEIQTIINAGRYSGIATRTVGEYTVFTATEDLQEGRTFGSPKIIKASSFVDLDDLGGLLEFCK